MRVTDLVVEVRDGSLARVGQVDERFLSGVKVKVVRNDVGAWQLTLPSDHDLVTTMQSPKSGLIVTGPAGVIMSGPMTSGVHTQSTSDPKGAWTFTGLSDLVFVQDAFAFPQPSNPDPFTQTVDKDSRSGPVETLLHQFVNANIGPSAPSARKAGTFWEKIVMGADGGRGDTRPMTANFTNLLELCQQIAAGTEIWFDVRQDGDELRFVTGVGVDRTAEVRMDIDNQQLDRVESGFSAPGVTFLIEGGAADSVNKRTMAVLSNSAAVTEWGRRIEVFDDQRQTNDITELQATGTAKLTDNGSTGRSLKVVPSQDTVGTYGVTWSVGDRVTTVLESTEVPARVNGMSLTVDDTALRLAATIGDDVATDWESGVDQSIQGLSSRVSNLERNTDTGVAGVDLSAYLLSGFSGSVQGSRDGQTVEIVGAVTGTVPTASGVTNFLGALPNEWRPTGPNRWGAAYAGGAASGYTGGAVVRADGSAGFANRTAASWTAVQFSVSFVRG